MTIGAFTTSIMGMNAQAHAMGQISANIANVSTTAYKKAETLFETKMSIYSETTSDKNSLSVGIVDRRFVDVSGQIVNTGSVYNLALDGQGFFIVNDGRDTFYTRAGDFEATTVTPNGTTPKQIQQWYPEGSGKTTQSGAVSYLKNSAGYYVMGWNADGQGNFTSSSLEPIVITPPEYYPGQASTSVTLKGNLNASATEEQVMSFPVYNNSYAAKSAVIKATPTDNASTWGVDMTMEGATSVTVSPAQIRYNSAAKIVEPENGIVTAQVAWEDGTTSTIALNLTNVTQYASTTNCSVLSQDGKAYGNFRSLEWNDDGVLLANYDNGTQLALCKTAVAQVQVPNNMEAITGNMFAYSRACGSLNIVDLSTADTSTSVAGNSLEKSNVVLEEEFSRMIVTQRAYSGNTKTFTTVDEMIQEAVSIIS